MTIVTEVLKGSAQLSVYCSVSICPDTGASFSYCPDIVEVSL